LILTDSAKCGNVVLNAGPKLQLFKFRRWLSKAGLISQYSSSLDPPAPGVLAVPPGVGGAGGEPACAVVLYGEEVENCEEDADEPFDADTGRRQSRDS
jgi:hypothetical protein